MVRVSGGAGANSATARGKEVRSTTSRAAARPNTSKNSILFKQLLCIFVQQKKIL
jgi:hypothetical protein